MGRDSLEPQSWPRGLAIVLTLFLVLVPYAVDGLIALVNPWAIAGVPALTAGTLWTFPTIQRLVNFMLVGTVDGGPAELWGQHRRPTVFGWCIRRLDYSGCKLDSQRKVSAQ